MTIDEAIKILSCEELDSSVGCGASYEDIDEALGVAIETMRKYQKIEQIMKRRYGRYHIEIVQEIKEVLEDGKID